MIWVDEAYFFLYLFFLLCWVEAKGGKKYLAWVSILIYLLEQKDTCVWYSRLFLNLHAWWMSICTAVYFPLLAYTYTTDISWVSTISSSLSRLKNYTHDYNLIRNPITMYYYINTFTILYFFVSCLQRKVPPITLYDFLMTLSVLFVKAIISITKFPLSEVLSLYIALKSNQLHFQLLRVHQDRTVFIFQASSIKKTQFAY